MKLKNYIENLSAIIKSNPNALDMDVVTSRDNEGNGYTLVYYSPSIGNYSAEEWYTENDVIEEGLELNAVLLN